MQLKKLLKKFAALSPIVLTRSEYYDRLTEKVIRQVCKPTSICIDAGANEGKILEMMIRNCPQVLHYAFEPLPGLYHSLKRKYSSAAHIYNVALSNINGEQSFNYVVTNPAYSGLQKRKYDRQEKDETIKVRASKLDDIIPLDQPIALIKLDIEGGEYDALCGAKTILTKWHPTLLFEFGKGGADAYGITPEMMFQLLTTLGYSVYSLPNYLNKKPAYTLPQFSQCFIKGTPFFYVAFASKEKSWNY